MTAFQQSQNSPKHNLRTIRILFWAVIGGALMFAVSVLGLGFAGMDIIAKGNEFTTVFWIVAAMLAVMALLIAGRLYRRSIATAKDSLIPLNDKLNSYRTALIVYIALCEGPALFAIIAYLLTGNVYLLSVTAVMIFAMLRKMPSQRRVAADLSLDWQQQQELE